MLTIGRKIKKLRELKNYTQDYMADQLGISQPAYSKLETDETEISHVRLTQIANALGVTVQDILSFDEKVFYNQMNNHNAAGSGYTINQYGISEIERKLFEDKIRLLEEMNAYLKKQLAKYEQNKP